MPKRPKRPKRNPASSRVGRPPKRPTAEQRDQVELAVSVGLSVDMVSAALATPRRTLYRHFANEIACGRAKRLLANAIRIDKAACEGSVAAMKYLHTLMLDHGPASAAAHDQWGDFDEDDILAQNSDFGGMNGHRGQGRNHAAPSSATVAHDAAVDE